MRKSKTLRPITLGSTSAGALDGIVADLILGSPPYCTRIDYVISTLPELAVLGYCNEDLAVLRASMLGTPTMAEDGVVTTTGMGSNSQYVSQ